MTQKPTFSANISLGNALQILSLVVAAAIGYATVNAQVSSINEKIERDAGELEKTQVQLAAKITAMENRTRYLETSFARADERSNSMFGLLKSIDDRLERIERKDQP